MTLPALARLPEPILVVGAYGYRNVGDEAILSGLLAELGRGRRVTVVSRSPAETQSIHGVPAVGVTRALAALRRHRSVLIGGGGLFGRDMGHLGRLIAPFAATAALAGKQVAFAGIGVDPDPSRMTVACLRLLAARGASIGVRDAASARVFAESGISAGIGYDFSQSLVPDSAAEARGVLRSAGIDPGRPVIGLALTALNAGAASELPEALEAVAGVFPDIQLCFVPMSQHPFVPAHNDLLLARQLQEAVPQLRVVTGLYHPSTILALFGQFSAAVCMRYHALLFAARMGAPLVAVPYAEKCRTWIADHGHPVTRASGRALTAALASAMAAPLARPA